MLRSTRPWITVATAIAAMSALGSTARAQTTTPAPTSTTTTTAAPVVSQPVVERESVSASYAPNPYMLTTGFILFGAPYLTGIVVAAQSSNSADQHLYVPIAGPWIDLGNRGGCHLADNSCNGEATNKVLLALDGTLQAIGTIDVIWGFLSPVHREVTTVHATRYTPEITLQPSRVASGYGLTAFGRF